jgi:2-polyprenyl-3-methyl-5-hydroxy-6-metoxy-1,4-benzoquinol methylase
MSTENKTASVATSPLGFKHLDPIPSNESIGEFYQTEYYELLRKGGRAPELQRLTKANPDAERERLWLHSTLYDDVLDILQTKAPKGRVLDVGCGPGELVEFLAKRNINASGFDPSKDTAAGAAERGLNVTCNTIETYLQAHQAEQAIPFAAVVSLNVLEHVPDPIGLVEGCHQLLMPGGTLVIRVPNDFTEIQAAAHAKLGGRKWWIIPDHINYFDVSSLRRLFETKGFEIVDTMCDFPMELFLLFGDDYSKNSEVGSQCHYKRVNFELAVGSDLRRHWYGTERQ